MSSKKAAAYGFDVVADRRLSVHRLVEDAVVDVGEIHDVRHPVAGDLQVPAKQVVEKESAQVSNVRKVPHCRPAGVHADVSGLEGFEHGLRPGESVVQPQCHRPRVASAGCLDQRYGLRRDAILASQRTQTLR